jgi:hypothetical protein
MDKEITCPQCKMIIPAGNKVCNYCGFNYQDYLQKQIQSGPKKSGVNPWIILFVIFIIAITVIPNILIPRFLMTMPEEKIMEYMPYLPVVIIGIFLIVFVLSIVVAVTSQKK